MSIAVCRPVRFLANSYLEATGNVHLRIQVLIFLSRADERYRNIRQGKRCPSRLPTYDGGGAAAPSKAFCKASISTPKVCQSPFRNASSA